MGLSSFQILNQNGETRAAKRARRHLEIRNLFTTDFNRTGRDRCLEDILNISAERCIRAQASEHIETRAARPHREILSMETLKNKLWRQSQVVYGDERRAREKAAKDYEIRQTMRSIFPLEYRD